MGRCGQFAYGGCEGNGNRFSSEEECEYVCVTHQEEKPRNVTNEAASGKNIFQIKIKVKCKALFILSTTQRVGEGVLQLMEHL